MESDCEVMVSEVACDRGIAQGYTVICNNPLNGVQAGRLSLFIQSQCAKNDYRIKRMLFN
ncbi:Uncharacterised protein [Serratia proteamaculans]|nr:Uncharacterised protein [Serratia proteamaculans]